LPDELHPETNLKLITPLKKRSEILYLTLTYEVSSDQKIKATEYILEVVGMGPNEI